jgi:hypothetical protein
MKMSDDDSPILRRGGRTRGKAPVISPDSQSQRPSKFAVPPSPGNPALPASPLSSPVILSPGTPAVLPSPVSSALSASVSSDDDSASVSSSSVEARPAGRVSRRQRMLKNRFLDHQAKEGKEGSSVDGSSNSDDDQYCFPVVLLCLHGI